MIQQTLGWDQGDMPDGITYTPDWLIPFGEDDIVKEIDASPWEVLRVRRVQQYGQFYGYASKLNGERVEPMPGWLDDLCYWLVESGGMSQHPDNVIVNEYLEGQGINPHIDSPWFGPEVVSLSLLDSWAMDFTKGFDKSWRILLERYSLLKLTGPARSEWKHAINPRKNDYVAGTLRPRGPRRISVTFRTVVGETPAPDLEEMIRDA